MKTVDPCEVTAETVTEAHPPIVTDVMSTNADRSLDELHDVIAGLAGMTSRIAAAINARAKGGR